MRRLRTEGLNLISFISGITYLWLGFSYLRPPARSSSAVSIVAYIEQLGPVWVLVFGLTGATLSILACIDKADRFLSGAHVAGAAVACFYAGCVAFGQLLSDPPRLSPTGVLAVGVMFGHIALSRAFYLKERP